jgi:amino acid adenylation domain-containing protein
MDGLLHHRLEAAARERPDHPAVVDQGRECSYAQLDARANAVAQLLCDHGVRRGDRVGLYLERRLESVIGLYAVLKAGAAYVPLDPQAPLSRLGYILDKCGTGVLLAGSEKLANLGRLAEGRASLHTIVLLDGAAPPGPGLGGVALLPADAADAHPPTPPRLPAAGDDLAYILFTSGSTGDPKGVMLSHANGLAFVDWAVERLGITGEDRLANHAPLHFDLSVLDIFAAVSARATVVLAPPRVTVFPTEIPRFVDQQRITVWYSVPSVLTRMVQALPHLGGRPVPRLVLFAGEPFPVPFLDRLMRAWPSATFCNLYGPTETNVCTFLVLDGPPGADVPPVSIGRPIDGVEVLLVTDDGTPAAPGDVGELCVRGATVMRGYWDEPELTSRALVAVPGRAAAERMYRTGDLARVDAHGDYHLLGRRDHQVKSRGYRIELGEVETVLYRHPAVLAAAVLAVPDEIVTNRLVAFVTLTPDGTAEEVTRFCAAHLPAYMVPDRLLPLPAMPTTSTGKVDRQRLRAEAAAQRGDARDDR